MPGTKHPTPKGLVNSLCYSLSPEYCVSFSLAAVSLKLPHIPVEKGDYEKDAELSQEERH